METKRCRECGETKSVDEFERQKDRPQGRTARCSACLSKWRARRYQALKGRPKATGEKPCGRCGKTLPMSEFYPNASFSSGYASYCKKCTADVSVQQRHSRAYGLTREEYKRIEIRSGGKCEACGDAPSEGKRLALDHDHSTGRGRGMLCAQCNTALGMVRDDPDRLYALAAYLLQGQNILGGVA